MDNIQPNTPGEILAGFCRRREYERLKSLPCVDCNYSFPTYCMDFDHREPSGKCEGVARLFTGRMAWSRLIAEIAKCDLVCANCHRIREHDRRQV